jgi:(4S)-4-hydroxy-5-phosphonooxypentane-2,3-dione isomerase
MIANFVAFQLKPGQRDAFIEASLGNSRGSIEGPGCVATSIFADPARPNVAYVFEVFVDEAAFNNHHDQPYYQQWLAAIGPMLAEPYQMLQSTTFPDDASWRHLRMAVAGSEDPASWT